MRGDIHLELGRRRELHRADRIAHQRRIAGALFVGRNRRDERCGLRAEHVRRAAQDLASSPSRAARFPVLMPCFLAMSSVTSAARGELIAPELAESGAHGVEHRHDPGPSGFSLLARIIGEPRLRVRARFEAQVEETGFAAAARHPESGSARAHSLNESTSRQRHS